MSKKALSTYEREMQNPEFRKGVEKEYKKLVISELVIALMTNNHKSVRSLAKECGLSPAAINKLRTGKQDDVMLRNFINIAKACGYHLVLEKGNEKIFLSPELQKISTPQKKIPTIAPRAAVAARKSKISQHARKAG